MSGLYVHVPFCEARCSYCAFATWTDRHEQQQAYFAGLARELERRAAGLDLTSIYFGGGTPSLPDPSLLADALRRIRGVARVAPDAEITLEVNPESASDARAAAWREAGFNRASIGAQSFDPRVLEAAGRLHGPEGIPRAVASLRRAGFDDLSLDLIAGLPHESAASLADSRRRALELEPEHVSLYLLELDEAGKNSPLAAAVRLGRVSVISDDEMADWYEASHEDFAAAGLAAYEISSFARPGRESRHNLLYWTCEPFAAAGVAAHWFDGARRRFNHAGFEAWLRAAQATGDGEAPESQDAPPVDLPQDRLMLGLRLMRGIDLASLDALHPGSLSRFAPLLSQGEADGLLTHSGHTWRLTMKGRLLSNELFQQIVSA